MKFIIMTEDRSVSPRGFDVAMWLEGTIVASLNPLLDDLVKCGSARELSHDEYCSIERDYKRQEAARVQEAIRKQDAYRAKKRAERWAKACGLHGPQQ